MKKKVEHLSDQLVQLGKSFHRQQPTSLGAIDWQKERVLYRREKVRGGKHTEERE